MAFTLDLGFTPGTTTVNLPVDTITKSDYVLTGSSEDEAAYVGADSTLGRPEKLKYGRRIIKDIYANSSVDSAYRCPCKTGIKVLLSTETVGSLTESGTPAFRQDFPFTVKTVVDVPASDYLTADQVLSLIKHHCGMILDDGNTVTSSRIQELLKGSLELS